jgi:DNA segregation ATPase FtsK/SpoIIIE, S-DNA-T family
VRKLPVKIDPRSSSIATNEIGAINRIFQARRLQAKITTPGLSYLAPQHWVYVVSLHPSVKPADVAALQDSIAEAITHLRREPTPVRIQYTPLGVEVPAVYPRPVRWTTANWQIQPGEMIAGTTYAPAAYGGEKPLLLDIYRQHHLLVAGMSGAGKSTALQMLVTSLAASTSPEDCQFWFIDRRNAELTDLKRLPHVVAHASQNEDSHALIVALNQELERRIVARAKTPHILLVVDELAALAENRETTALINDLLNRGRGNGIGSVLATQHPTQQAIGSISLANITARLVGAVANATTANFVTGQPGTGAHNLKVKTGSFVYVEGQDVLRVQTYLVPEEEVQAMVAGIRKRWAAARPAMLQQPAPEPEPKEQPIPANVVQAFRDNYNETTGELQWGGLSAIIRALFGPDANTGGSYKRRAEEVVQRLKTTTTTAYAHQINHYSPK